MAEANPNPTAAPAKGRRPTAKAAPSGTEQMQGEANSPTQMSDGQQSGGQMSGSAGDRPLYSDWAMI